MRSWLTIFIIFNLGLLVRGQDMLGVVNSNYAGIYGIVINPANMTSSKLYMDFNLIGLNSAFDNNYMYLSRNDYYNLLFKNISPLYFTSKGEDRTYAIFEGNSYKYGYQSERVIGPSAMMVYGKHAFGISTALRSNTSFNNLPDEIGIFLYEAIDYDPQHGISYTHDKPIRIASLTWYEMSFSYAYNFRRYKWDSWSFGISLKPLFGYAGFYANIDNVDYEVFTDTTASIYNASFSYAYSLPVDYSQMGFQTNPLVKGKGVSGDIGITYQKTAKGHSNKFFSRLCEQPYEEYNYKFGLSFLDFGFIKFSKKANKRTYQNTSTYWYEPFDTLPTTSLEEIDTKVASYFMDNASQVSFDQKFIMNTPPAISFQFDYHINKPLYVNTMLVYGIPLGNFYVKRPVIFAITPRYETNRMEVSIPVSLYEWNFSMPRIGFSFRYGNIFFGFDKLNTFFGLSNFTGYDIYFGIRLNLTNNLRMNYIKGNCENRKLRNIETFDYRNF